MAILSPWPALPPSNRWLGPFSPKEKSNKITLRGFSMRISYSKQSLKVRTFQLFHPFPVDNQPSGCPEQLSQLLEKAKYGGERSSVKICQCWCSEGLDLLYVFEDYIMQSGILVPYMEQDLALPLQSTHFSSSLRDSAAIISTWGVFYYLGYQLGSGVVVGGEAA